MTGWYPDPCNSSTFCRELEGALAGEVSASGRFHALFRAHLGLPARLRRPFGLKDRFSPLPRDGDSDPQRPRCLPCWGTPRGGTGHGPANRTRTLAPSGVGRYPQDVPRLWIRGPRIVSSCIVPCSDGAGARARAGY
jgi:hypothetical protein